MSLLSARDFTLVMLAIVFLAGAASIALLNPFPTWLNPWASAGLSLAALLMVFFAFFPHRFGTREPLPKDPRNKSAAPPPG